MGHTHSKPLLTQVAAIVILIALLSGMRGWSLLTYTDASLRQALAADLPLLFWMGLRFDLKIVATLLLIPVLLQWLLILVWPARQGVLRIQKLSFYLLAGLISFLGLVQHYYYGYYKTPFTPTVFGLFDDDTKVVLLTIWNDYPVLQLIAAIALLTGLQIWLWRQLASRYLRASGSRRSLLSLGLLILLLVFLTRGTTASQPLNRENFTVSTNRVLCDLVPNGVTALYYAWQDYRTQVALDDDPLKGLKDLGFSSPSQAAETLGLAPSDQDAALITQLTRTTSAQGAKTRRPPHVVMVLMESWGMQALDRQASDTPIQGRMARHIQEDYFFRYAVSSRRGTHPSLESILLSTPITPLTQGRYGQIAYLTAAARPFKEAGYHTLFIYGGSARWRAMNRAFIHQGFDEVLDLANIQQQFPNTTINANGAHDQYLYGLIQSRLAAAEAEHQPLMVFMLTTSNHTPYTAEMTPADYQAAPLPLARFADTQVNPADLPFALRGFQYANDTLADFIGAIKQSAYADHTLIAAAGDHYLRNFFRLRMNEDMHWMDRVGLYFRIPSAYLLPGEQFDAAIAAGHRDIFPTLYEHALSGQRYLSFGRNLFAANQRDGTAVTDLTNVYSRYGVALGLQHPLYYRWNQDRTSLVADPEPDQGWRTILRQEKARIALQDWLIRRQAVGQP